MGAFGKLKASIQILIVAGVCAALLGAVWYWFLKPIQLDIDAKATKLQEITLTVEKSKARQASLDQFKKESELLVVQLNEAKKALPQEKETADLFDQVQASAKASNLRIQQAVSKSGADHEVYIDWPVDMEVQGTYHNLASFFDKIRQLPRILNVTKLRIESRAAEGANSFTASVGATYEATTFVYREEVADTAPAAKPVKAK